MRIVSESPEEDRMVQEVAGKLMEEGVMVNPVSYEMGFFDTMISFSDEVIPAYEWTPEQRIRFQERCEEFARNPEVKALMESFRCLAGSMDLEFREEEKAFLQAVQDYGLLLEVLDVAQKLRISSQKGLTGFLKDGLPRKNGISTICARYEKEFSSFAIQINSLLVPLNASLKPDTVIYGWKDADFGYTHSFLRMDLEKALVHERGLKVGFEKGMPEKGRLDFMIQDAEASRDRFLLGQKGDKVSSRGERGD